MAAWILPEAAPEAPVPGWKEQQPSPRPFRSRARQHRAQLVSIPGKQQRWDLQLPAPQPRVWCCHVNCSQSSICHVSNTQIPSIGPGTVGAAWICPSQLLALIDLWREQHMATAVPAPAMTWLPTCSSRSSVQIHIPGALCLSGREKRVFLGGSARRMGLISLLISMLCR